MARPQHDIAFGATFMATAEKCPQVLLRVIGLFAQLNLVVDRVEVSRSSRALRIAVTISGLDAHRIAIIAEKMRQMVMVQTVRVRHSRHNT